MSTAQVNGTQLFYELSGSGEITIVLVHGAWASHHTWDSLVPLLAESFQVLTYDRRGHSQSERPPGQGSIREDIADLAALIEYLELAPAWVVGNSQGGLITLRLAGERPELLRGLSVHEPPLFSLIENDSSAAPALEKMRRLDSAVAERIASGDNAGAAEQFIEAIAGPGSWAQLPEAYRQELIYNAPTYLDETRDPEVDTFDPAWIEAFPRPVLLTKGDSLDAIVAPMYARAAELLPQIEILSIPGGDHLPQRYQPEVYAETITSWIGKNPA
jgi:pimeloyl-ACP methyl ester carboxylesterase